MPTARPGDREAAEAMRLFLAPQAAPELTFGTVMLGPPHSKTRPRFAEGRTYKTAEDETAEQQTAWWLRRIFTTPLTGNLALGAIFYRPNRQEIDTDNLIKHVCDAGNGIAWVDDAQITAVYGRIELDADHPRTVLVVAPHVSSMLRGTDNVRPCDGCGMPFTPPREAAKYCSRPCATVARAAKAVRP